MGGEGKRGNPSQKNFKGKRGQTFLGGLLQKSTRRQRSKKKPREDEECRGWPSARLPSGDRVGRTQRRLVGASIQKPENTKGKNMKRKSQLFFKNFGRQFTKKRDFDNSLWRKATAEGMSKPPIRKEKRTRRRERFDNTNLKGLKLPPSGHWGGSRKGGKSENAKEGEESTEMEEDRKGIEGKSR